MYLHGKLLPSKTKLAQFIMRFKLFLNLRLCFWNRPSIISPCPMLLSWPYLDNWLCGVQLFYFSNKEFSIRRQTVRRTVALSDISCYFVLQSIGVPRSCYKCKEGDIICALLPNRQITVHGIFSVSSNRPQGSHFKTWASWISHL